MIAVRSSGGTARWPAITRHAAVDDRLHLGDVDAGEGGQHQHLVLGLQHVDRRLPGDLARWAPTGWNICWCIRSALASIESASDHIQSCGSFAMALPFLDLGSDRPS